MIEKGRAEGTLVFGGKRVGDVGYFIEPTRKHLGSVDLE
jgi:septin family protein